MGGRRERGRKGDEVMGRMERDMGVGKMRGGGGRAREEGRRGRRKGR